MEKNTTPSPIAKFYEKHRGKKPEGLTEFEIARAIIEIFGSREFISAKEEKECADYIRYKMPCDDKKTHLKLILDMEDFQGYNSIGEGLRRAVSS